MRLLRLLLLLLRLLRLLLLLLRHVAPLGPRARHRRPALLRRVLWVRGNDRVLLQLHRIAVARSNAAPLRRRAANRKGKPPAQR